MKLFFALGLVLQIIAQMLFSVHSEKIELHEPVGTIRWTLLLGVVLN